MGAKLIPKLDAPSSVGSPLEPTLQHQVRAARNVDLSGVRVHVGHEATHLGAAAFTSGTDIFVAPGSDYLVPHEAWHCVQQGAAVVMPLAENLVEVNPSASGSGTPSSEAS